MTIDACIWLESGQSAGTPAAEALSCVEASLVMGFRSDHLSSGGAQGGIDHVARFVAEAPERRLGAAGIDPTSPGALDDLARAIDLGLRAVCVSPADQNCRPTSDRFLEAMEWCAAREVPVFVQNPRLCEPRSVLEFASPALLDEAARTIPSLRMVLGDLGVFRLDETMCLLAKHPRMYAETSAIVRHARRAQRVLIEAMERGVMHKLLFGSGWPHVTPEAAIERLYGAASFTAGAAGGGGGPGVVVPREQVRAIVERDTLELLDIDMIPGTRAVFETSPLGAGERT